MIIQKEGPNHPMLTSYCCIPFISQPSQGKTTQMNYILNEYIENSKLFQYNLETPTVINGAFTHIIYISPNNPYTDDTLAKQPNNEMRTYVKTKPMDVAVQALEDIMKMADDVSIPIMLQEKLRKTMRNEEFMAQITNLQGLGIKNRGVKGQLMKLLEPFKQSILAINQIKYHKNPMYQKLLINEPDTQVKFNLQMVYQILGLLYDGKAIRSQKIALILDDCSSLSIFRSQGSAFFEILTNRRHCGLFVILFSLHSITNQFSQFREQYTARVIFSGQKEERIRDMFDEIQSIRSATYNEETFLEQYRQCTGYYLTQAEKKIAGSQYSFIYIITQPEPHIFKGWFEELQI